MVKNIKEFLMDNLDWLATLSGALGVLAGLGLVAKYERESDPALLRCFVYNLAQFGGSAAVRGFDDNFDGRVDRITAEWRERSVGNRLSKEYVPGDVDFVSLENSLIKRGHLKGTRANRIVGYFGKGEI